MAQFLKLCHPGSKGGKTVLFTARVKRLFCIFNMLRTWSEDATKNPISCLNFHHLNLDEEQPYEQNALALFPQELRFSGHIFCDTVKCFHPLPMTDWTIWRCSQACIHGPLNYYVHVQVSMTIICLITRFKFPKSRPLRYPSSRCYPFQIPSKLTHSRLK